MPAPVALTMGEPAGIGGEVTLKAWLKRREYRLPCFFVIDDPVRLNRLAQHLNLPVPIEPINDPAEAEALFEQAI
ncbi:MAG: 4-hydroxythreonine-4-phosphate dehydrogenase PdxA, partial [Alphaproteobacteria bacterium]